MIGAFTGTIDQVAKDPSGYTRFSGITGYQGLGLGNVQALILYINTQKQMQAMLSPVSRVASSELRLFERGIYSSADIKWFIEHREQRNEPHEFVI